MQPEHPIHGQIWIDGEFFSPEEARVSVYDRSYLYGDSLYEVARTYDGRLYAMKEHLERLRQTARLCHLDLHQSDPEIQAACQQTLDHFYRTLPHASGKGRPEAYCRIIVSRGRGRIGFGLENLQTPSLLTVIVQALDEPSPERRARGISLKIVDRRRLSKESLHPAAKTGNYLNCLLAFLEATQQGADDALLLNADGHVTEGTTFNVFYVRRGILVTPPLSVGILEGITRAQVITLARRLAIPVRETLFSPEHLLEADEAFITGTVKEILPISEINDQPIGRAGRRPITQRLWREFQLLTRGKKPEAP